MYMSKSGLKTGCPQLRSWDIAWEHSKMMLVLFIERFRI